MTVTRISHAALAIALVSAATAAWSQETKVATAADAEAEADTSEIIVTGTRAAGISAIESAAPIKVLGAEAISHVGQPNLNQVLSQLVPSFTTEAFGGDTANLTLSARLRGLSPNHTLVLVNGKRRHGTANLHVLGGPFQGGASPDLDLIPPASIARIEVLEDGAAAQYGTDAIAGVINIILKDNSEGGLLSATGGQYYKGDGDTYSATANLGIKIGEGGFVNVTLFHRYHDYSDRGGNDVRVSNRDGSTKTSLTAAQQALYLAVPGYPHVNHINGDAKSRLSGITYNAGYDFGSVEVYSFGGYNRRRARAFENFRVPDRILGTTPPSGSGGVLGAPGTTVPFPQGFDPKEGLDEEDYAVTGGIKGDVGGFTVDLSTTYGIDNNKIFTFDSANRSLFLDTGLTPRDFYDGSFIASEWTTNVDVNRELDIGLTAPVNLAFGAEYRENQFEIKSGDVYSIYKEGGQSYPGFRPSDAGVHKRDNYAFYADVAITPIEGLKLDGAIRYEHYSDFGSKVIEKLTARYDFNEMFALRGTVSTGFRAPTLAEEFYSATNVSPTSAFVQLPANSAAAKLIGFQDLKPEKSTNFSIGTVIRPADRLAITIDAYQVRIRDRILGTGSIFGSGGSTNFPAVVAAIVANGNILDPTVSQTGINIFTNGANTRTRGIDVVLSYRSDFDRYGSVNWTLSGNYNETKLTKTILAPAQLTPPGGTVPIALFDQTAVSLLETASPKVKIVANALWALDALSVNLRVTGYGKTSAFYSPDGGLYTENTVKATAIVDLEVGYDITTDFNVSLGANNLFNKKADNYLIDANGDISDGGNVFDAPLGISPYGINGGYYYARATFKF